MTTAKNPSLLSLINKRLSGIAKSELVEPTQKPTPLDRVVGHASLAIKRLYTLEVHLAAEINACTDKISAILPKEALKIKEDLRSILEWFIDADRDEYDLRQDELAELQRELERLRTSFNIVDLLMWSEIRSTFPAISHKAQLGIALGWEVFWRDANPDEPETLLDRLLSS